MSGQVAVVVIKDAAIQSRKVGDYTFQSQQGYLCTSADEVIGIDVSLPRNEPGYPPGRYFIGGQSFDRDQYGRPTFAKRGLYLIPVPVAVPGAAPGAGR
jgi:hypothetical protein